MPKELMLLNANFMRIKVFTTIESDRKTKKKEE